MKRGGRGAAGPRVVLLGAVSRGEKTQDPESQLVALRAVARRLGWNVVHELRIVASRWDAQEAARVRAAAVAAVQEHDADLLAVWAWDRVNREGIEAAFRILRELEDHQGVRFFSLQEPMLSTATDPQTRELALAWAAYAAKWESQRKSDRGTAKALAKRTLSDNLGVRPIWGGAAEGKARLATLDDVRDVIRLRKKWMSVREIAEELQLSKSQVDRILRGEIASLPVELQEQLAKLRAKKISGRPGPGGAKTSTRTRTTSCAECGKTDVALTLCADDRWRDSDCRRAWLKREELPERPIAELKKILARRGRRA